MKRPLALVGFSYLLTLAAAVFIGFKWAPLLAGMCLIAFIGFLFVPSLRAGRIIPAAALTMALAFTAFSLYSSGVAEPAASLAEKDAVIQGTVCELPVQSYQRTYYIVEVNSVSLKNAPQHLKIRLSCKNALQVQPFSRICGRVHFFLPSGGEGYTSRTYYASKGIMLFAYLYEYENVAVTPPADKPPYYYALQLRRSLLKSIREILPPEQASLVNGIVFGDQTSLSDEISSDFRTIGISHILSVSGLHMSTMAELILLLLLFFRVPKKPAALLAAGGVFGFMAVTCFVPSVTRSGVMCLLYLFGLLFSRKPDSLNSLGASVLIISLPNPYAAADIGLLLSFFATLGLILFSGRISDYLNLKFDKIKKISPLVRGMNGTLATTFGAMFLTVPVGIVFFGSVSLIAPVSNLLELVPSTLLMNFAAIAAVLNLAFPQSCLAMPFALVAGLLAKYMQYSAHWLAQIPCASISASYGFVLVWLAGTLLLAAAALLMVKSKRIFHAAAALSVILLLTGILSYQVVQRDATRIAVLDVGSAESVVLTRNGHAAVVGCGGFASSAISRYLTGQGVSRVDYIQPLTRDRQESANCSKLMDMFRPEYAVLPDSEVMDGFLESSLLSAKRRSFYRERENACLWGEVHLQTAVSGKNSAVRLSDGQTSVLIVPQDMGPSEVPQEWLCSDFLVLDSVPENSAAFEPVYTVLSVDRENLAPAAARAKSLNPIATGGAGSIVLAVKDHALQIRREP